jgi:hypothetical protein
MRDSREPLVHPLQESNVIRALALTATLLVAGAVPVPRPGGRLVLAGVKLGEGPWRGAVNPLVRLLAGLALATPVTELPWLTAE